MVVVIRGWALCYSRLFLWSFIAPEASIDILVVENPLSGSSKNLVTLSIAGLFKLTTSETSPITGLDKANGAANKIKKRDSTIRRFWYSRSFAKEKCIQPKYLKSPLRSRRNERTLLLNLGRESHDWRSLYDIKYRRLHLYHTGQSIAQLNRHERVNPKLGQKYRITMRTESKPQKKT